MSEHPPVNDGKTYWLDKPSSLNLIIIGLVIACVISFAVPTILDLMPVVDVPDVDPHHGDAGHGDGHGDAGHGGDHGGQESHRYFDYESIIGFHAFFGFCAYATIVFGAKVLRKIIMRPEEYYE
jgi:hypothetical protein